MTSLIYNTGTVALTNGSATVTGSGTGWAVALVTGGLFSCAGMAIPIASVESDTSLTLAYAWTGGDATGAAYAIARDTSEATRAAWTNDRLATIIQKLSLVGIHPDGSGTLTERDALDPAPSVGYLWLYVESGHDLAFYRKTASGWDGPFDVRGAVGDPGESGAAATIAVGTVTTGAPGDPVTVTNSGTPSAAVFNFEIPQGDPGTGDVDGPAGVTDGAVAIFDGTTGKAIKATADIVIDSGRVGVGTTAPIADAVLEVRKDQATPNITRIAVNNPNANGLSAFSLYGGPGNVEQGRMQYNNNPTNVFFTTTQNIPFYIGTNNTPRITITPAGSVNVTSGLVSAVASAKLQIDSTTQGFLPPRMTNTQRDAISSPAEGLVIYSTTDHEPQYRNGSAWIGTSPKAKSFTVATLPSASATGAGGIAYASDASGGAIPVFCDGTNWRKFSDRSIVA